MGTIFSILSTLGLKLLKNPKVLIALAFVVYSLVLGKVAYDKGVDNREFTIVPVPIEANIDSIRASLMAEMKTDTLWRTKMDSSAYRKALATVDSLSRLLGLEASADTTLEHRITVGDSTYPLIQHFSLVYYYSMKKFDIGSSFDKLTIKPKIQVRTIEVPVEIERKRSLFVWYLQGEVISSYAEDIWAWDKKNYSAESGFTLQTPSGELDIVPARVSDIYTERGREAQFSHALRLRLYIMGNR